MIWDREPGEPNVPALDEALSPEQLRGLQDGVGAVILPVTDGWRIRYFSLPDFDAEPGTTFSSFDAAMAALQKVLPVINTDEERARARQELHEQLDRSGNPPA